MAVLWMTNEAKTFLGTQIAIPAGVRTNPAGAGLSIARGH
jgi:hypothetical protein